MVPATPSTYLTWRTTSASELRRPTTYPSLMFRGLLSKLWQCVWRDVIHTFPTVREPDDFFLLSFLLYKSFWHTMKKSSNLPPFFASFFGHSVRYSFIKAWWFFTIRQNKLSAFSTLFFFHCTCTRATTPHVNRLGYAKRETLKLQVLNSTRARSRWSMPPVKENVRCLKFMLIWSVQNNGDW